MKENSDAKHSLMLNIKRLEGILEKIDRYNHDYNQEKMDASVVVLKIKSTIDNLREIIPEMGQAAESIDEQVNDEKD